MEYITHSDSKLCISDHNPKTLSIHYALVIDATNENVTASLFADVCTVTCTVTSVSSTFT